MDEELRLRFVVARDYRAHLPELTIALHTGMRPSEQYGLKWDRVVLLRRLISIPKSKNGKAPHPLEHGSDGCVHRVEKTAQH
jgi:integrase